MPTSGQGTKPQFPGQTSSVTDLPGLHCCVVLGKPWLLPGILFLHLQKRHPDLFLCALAPLLQVTENPPTEHGKTLRLPEPKT